MEWYVFYVGMKCFGFYVKCVRWFMFSVLMSMSGCEGCGWFGGVFV